MCPFYISKEIWRVCLLPLCYLLLILYVIIRKKYYVNNFTSVCPCFVCNLFLKRLHSFNYCLQKSVCLLHHSSYCSIFLLIKKNFRIIYLFWERQRQHEWGKGRERERERIQSRLCTVSTEPDVGLKLMKSWDHDLSWNWELDA